MEPTSTLTFKDIIIEAAFYAGIADVSSATEGPKIPTDLHELSNIKRMVNNAYRRFISEKQWQFLRPTSAITFATQFSGAATTGGTGSFIDTSRTETTQDFFKGYKLHFTRSDTSNYTAVVSSYDGSTKTFTLTDPTVVVALSDTYELADSTTVDGRAEKYLLPDDFVGELIGNPVYTAGTSTNATELEEVSYGRIRSLFSSAVAVTGTPTLYAIAPLDIDTSTIGPKWQLILWPRPSVSGTIVFQYFRWPNLLVNLNDRPVCGPQFDMALVAAARAQVEKDKFDKVGVEEANYQKLLEVAKELDNRSGPKRLGDYGPRERIFSSDGPPFTTLDIGTVNGLTI